MFSLSCDECWVVFNALSSFLVMQQELSHPFRRYVPVARSLAKLIQTLKEELAYVTLWVLPLFII